MCTSQNYCEMEGDIRVDPKKLSVVVVAPPGSLSYSTPVEPYPRPNSQRVKIWEVSGPGPGPSCTQRHPHPAILFSNTGYTGGKTDVGNFFHDFADLLFPLFTTASEFRRQVHFLVADYKPSWIRKYTPILNKLTSQHVLDMDAEALHAQVHCYSKLIISLKYHNVLITYPPLANSTSMHNFRVFLRDTFSLKRATATTTAETPPRLMIIDRKHNRVITNLGEVAGLAREVGFDVVAWDGSPSLAQAAEAVNSFDVLLGVHGAGLTNMLFLPDGAVVIQVVPLFLIRKKEKTKLYSSTPSVPDKYAQFFFFVRLS